MVRSTCSSWFGVSEGGENTCFIMGCGSPFGGFVSPFVGFVGFCIWVSFIFFAEITVASSYWWICYGFTIERKERYRFCVLENLVMGSQSQSYHNHIKHLASLNSYPNRPCMLASFFFFFGLTHIHYSIFSLCLVSKKIKGKKILDIVVCVV